MAVPLTDLRAFEPFTTLPRGERAALAGVAARNSFRADEPIYRMGVPSSEMTVVVAGFARLYRTTRNPGGITTGLIPPGQLLSVAPWLEENGSEGAAEAVGNVRILEVPIARVWELGAHYPVFAYALIDCLLSRAEDVYCNALTTGALPLADRVLKALRVLAPTRCGGGSGTDMRRLAIRLSHARLARIVHGDRGAVTRVLADLEQRGDVRRFHGRVTHVRGGIGPISHRDVVVP